MTVYCLFENEMYEGSVLCDIYATQEAANRAKKRKEQSGNDLGGVLSWSVRAVSVKGNKTPFRKASR